MVKLVRPRSWGWGPREPGLHSSIGAVLFFLALGCRGRPLTDPQRPGPPDSQPPAQPAPPVSSTKPHAAPSETPRLGPLERTGHVIVRPGSVRMELEPRGARSALRFSMLPAGDALLALDDHRPRALQQSQREMRLSALLPEDLELAPGPHNLILCGKEKNSLECSRLNFDVDSAWGVKESETKGPACVLLEPGGTYWGDSPVPLLAISVSEEEERVPSVSYRLVHPHGKLTFPAMSGETLSVRLPTGDTIVELECGSKDVVVRRAITVNPEPHP